VESDLAAREHERVYAESAEAWLLTLRERMAEVEADTDEARRLRGELARLSVERIAIGRDEEGRTKVDITYRFGPPAELEADSFRTVYEATKGSPMRTSMNSFLLVLRSSAAPSPGWGSNATLSTSAR
jgi:hypothetical protein